MEGFIHIHLQIYMYNHVHIHIERHACYIKWTARAAILCRQDDVVLECVLLISNLALSRVSSACLLVESGRVCRAQIQISFTKGSLACKDSVQHVAESRLPSMMQDRIS